MLYMGKGSICCTISLQLFRLYYKLNLIFGFQTQAYRMKKFTEEGTYNAEELRKRCNRLVLYTVSTP